MPQHSRSSEYCQLLVITCIVRELSTLPLIPPAQNSAASWQLEGWDVRVINYRQGIIVACFKSLPYLTLPATTK